jgi:hypothetical protein
MCGQAVAGCDGVDVASSVEFFLEGEACAVTVSHLEDFIEQFFILYVCLLEFFNCIHSAVFGDFLIGNLTWLGFAL